MGEVVVKFDRVARLDEAGEGETARALRLLPEEDRRDLVVLELADHSLYSLSKNEPRFSVWKNMLESRRDYGGYVYVEAELRGEVSEVREVFIPSRHRVQSVSEGAKDGRLAVVLPPSPSLRYLNPATPNFDKMLKMLRDAQRSGEILLVTVNPYTKEVIYVREVPADESPPAPPEEALTAVPLDNFRLDLSPFAITPEAADSEFEFLRTRQFIPFAFLENCCASRAHEMCDLMRRRGIVSGKVWNYGRGYLNCSEADPQDCPDAETLIGSHEDTPGVVETWLYHVAPVVSVIRPTGGTRLSVLDPSTFRRRRTVREWVEHMRDEEAEQSFSSARAHFLFPDGEPLFDDNFEVTCNELQKHRNELELLRLLP